MNLRASLFTFASAALLVALTGCGEVFKTSTITGRITDLQGRPVRNARVYTIDGETRSSMSGQYSISNNRASDLTVFAEITQDGVLWKGRNEARTVDGQDQLSVNVVIAPESQLARLRGRVTRSGGVEVAGARVFAYASGYFTSATTVTNAQGDYTLDGLIAGVTYTIQAGGRGYSNDTDSVSFSPGQTKFVDFFLPASGSPSLPAPTNVSGISWVTPSQPTLRGGRAPDWNAIKSMLDPERVATPSFLSRSTSSGTPIEIELRWSRLQGQDFYGYGIYRGIGTGSIVDYDFYREPMSGNYIDGNRDLQEFTQYRYQLTALGTDFPNEPGSESARSAIVSVNTLDDLTASAVRGPLQFSWNNNSGATNFVVYIFDRFPGVGVTSVWNNESNQVTGTGLNYNEGTNPGNLVRGNKYYYLVLGLANSNSSRTLSTIGTFVY